MPVKVTVVFKDGSRKVVETNPLGIDEYTRARNAVSTAVLQLTTEESKQVADYQLEDDYL